MFAFPIKIASPRYFFLRGISVLLVLLVFLVGMGGTLFFMEAHVVLSVGITSLMLEMRSVYLLSAEK